MAWQPLNFANNPLIQIAINDRDPNIYKTPLLFANRPLYLVAIIDRDPIISKNTRGLGLVPHASGAAAVAGLAIRIRKAPFSPPNILSRPSTAKLSTHLHLQLY
jgi:hypothetical protein